MALGNDPLFDYLGGKGCSDRWPKVHDHQIEQRKPSALHEIADIHVKWIKAPVPPEVINEPCSESPRLEHPEVLPGYLPQFL